MFFDYCAGDDTDNDGIVNQFDLDSDGDGCPDVLEAGVPLNNADLIAADVTNGNGVDASANTTNSITNAQLDPNGTDSTPEDGLNDSVDADGDGAVDYTSTYAVNALDANAQGANCPCDDPDLYADNCDFDNDGINNGEDLDDDNDGVLDREECELVGLDFNGVSIANPSVTNIFTNRQLTTNASVYPGITFDLDVIDVVGSNTSHWAEEILGNNTGDIALARDDNGEIAVRLTFSEPVDFVINEDKTLAGDTGGNDHWEFSIPSGSYEIVDNGTSDFTVNSSSATDLDISLNSTTNDDDWDIHFYAISSIELRFRSTFLGNRSVLNFNVCYSDTDNDGIVNRFELDSDDDGCSDAFEAGATTDLTVDYQFPDIDSNDDGLVDAVDDGSNGGTADDGMTDYTSTYATNALDDQIATCNAAPEITNHTSNPTATMDYAENGTGDIIDWNATDADGDTENGGGLTYALTGADAALFTLDTDTGVLTWNASPDFENPMDADMDNAYEVIVTVSDPAGATDEQALTINVTNVNEAPEVTAMATVSYPENGTTPVDNAETTDDTDTEGNGLTYTLTGTDAALFSIDANGEVTFNASPDYENPMDAGMDNVYDIVVNVADSGGLTDSTPMAITVTNVNEAPDVTATTTISYEENDTAVVDNAETTDDTNSENNGLTYTLTGPDAALFTIDADGNLEFITPPDFENPTDAGTDNVYNVTINVEDAGGLTDTEDVVITVTDEGEGNIRLSCVDPTNDKIVLKNFGTSAQDISQYRLCAGADYTTGGIGLDMTVTAGSLILQPGQTIELTGFNIDDTGSDLGIYYPTGAFSDPAAMLDFTQWGSGGNPRENVAVAKGIWTAGDFITDNPEFCYNGNGTTENGESFWDGNDNPVITSTNTAVVPENSPITTILLDVSSTDDNQSEGSGLTYSFSGVGANSPDEGDFNIDPTTGEITFLAVPDYENPTDDGTDNVYQVEVQVCDIGTPVMGCTTQIVTITVTDVDEDGDGFTGTDDPDDADPCVPSNAASPCCEAVAPTITKD